MDRTENDESNNSSIVTCAYVFNDPLPSSHRRNTYTNTDWWEGFMKYAVGMDSGTMIYIPSFIAIGPGIQKLIGGMHGHKDRMVIS
jgi:hypothetical protein